MRKIIAKFKDGSFANEAEKKEVMLAYYKDAIRRMNDMMVFPVSAEIYPNESAVAFIVRADEKEKVYACLNNLK